MKVDKPRYNPLNIFWVVCMSFHLIAAIVSIFIVFRYAEWYSTFGANFTLFGLVVAIAIALFILKREGPASRSHMERERGVGMF